jgi:acyl-CoA synthetase (NDP forming)
MKAANIIKKALAQGRTALNEHESKQLLAAYGVPVVQEAVARDALQAVDLAHSLGYPVVLKGLGSTLLHKTERGLVHLNLSTKAAVERAVHAIARGAGDELEGILVQPMLTGKREFVAGLSRDAVFGPVVMFGVGGIFTEALGDYSLRIAPLSTYDAREQIAEIKAQRLLGAFRGEQAPKIEVLISTLLGLSQLAFEHPEVAEVDINPLIVASSGEVRAADALVVLGPPAQGRPVPPPIHPLDIRNLFYPRSIAFIGASGTLSKWGHMLVVHTINGGYPGEIFLVNTKGGTIAGCQVYQSIEDVPRSVDLAVVTIPAKHVLELLPRLKAKGIRYVLLITSGFAETGTEGRRLQEELVALAHQEGLIILGPNTMGISNPHLNLHCTGSPVRPKPGGAAVVAQSGNMGVQMLGFAEEQGIGIRGFCGSGNEAMVTVEDFLDGFAIDDVTRIVILYVEGVRDGRRFFASACRLGRKKPIVLLKGGQSEAGGRAAASHTGVMTSDVRVFDAVCRQSGIVKVDQSMDLLDLAAAFSSLPLPQGKRVSIMTLGGGWGVITADLCARHGLSIATLTADLIARFDKILPSYWSKSNPVDIVGEMDNNLMTTIMEELLKWDGCDALINLGVLGRSIFFERMAAAVERADPSYSHDLLEQAKAYMRTFEEEYLKLVARLMETYHKPIFGVSLLTNEKSQTVYSVDGAVYKPVFYQSPEQAVKSCARMYEYYRFLQQAG